jgi:succinate dehydrogenase / fumarate reductase iron-sulfur subunit
MSIEKQLVTFKVFRFNRDTDYLPYYQEYKLEVGQDEVMLDILNRIKWEFDGSLSYRRSCRHGICGSCSIKVNQKPTLACKDRVFDLIDIFGTNLTIDPQSMKRAVKDMVVDKADFWSKYNSVKPYLEAEIEEHPEQENLVTPHEYEMLEEADYCIQCGGCYYACPVVDVNEEYVGPAALALAMRFNKDVRDNATKERLDITNQLGSGMWDCVKCMECAEACPKGVNPISKITTLHQQTFEEGVAPNNVATRHAVGFKHSIKKHGFLDEAGLVMYSDGLIKTATHHGSTGFKMFMAGKVVMPWNLPKSEKLDEIKKLVKISSKAKF